MAAHHTFAPFANVRWTLFSGLNVLEEMKTSFKCGSLFVFVSRCGKRLKLIYWDQTGFALWYKRLEKERFRWPRDHGEESIACSPGQLEKLLSGLDIFQKPHVFLRYDRIG